MGKNTGERTVRSKGTLGKILSVVIFFLVGMACSTLMTLNDTSQTTAGRILFLGSLFPVMYGAILVQTVIHEAGHLIFGLLTGYGFNSFRIFSLMWIQEDGKLRFRRYSLAGTGGQCLMIPPELKNGRMPVFLYNMGGAILNILSAAVFFGLSLLCRRPSFLAVILEVLAVMGVAMALLNGLPMRVGMVDNDGRNALSLSKDPQAMGAFWVQMRVIAETARGVRLKDMPAEWFTLPSDEDMQNAVIAGLGVLAANRLMDEHRFSEADALMERMLSLNSVVGLHRGMLLCDRVYVELMGENRPEALAKLRTKELEKTMKAMKTSPSVLRTQYALALLSEGDRAKAAKVLARFDKQTRTYPYPCEVEGERELMDMARERKGEADDPAI